MLLDVLSILILVATANLLLSYNFIGRYIMLIQDYIDRIYFESQYLVLDM
ncbi:hypothetical protein EMUCRT_0388 [Ehrlichia cf. muris str. EmCRT]|uniref:Uncharacterized protein n=1 Tax=Ehrlichia cf. muris str. EmCRT TaxID=1359167 RepID=A0A0F3NCG7_9RICK|nr:hypothetical protein EMUCRT_0388 [Ehrlichia cf. muris str. EmCRT]